MAEEQSTQPPAPPAVPAAPDNPAPPTVTVEELVASMTSKLPSLTNTPWLSIVATAYVLYSLPEVLDSDTALSELDVFKGWKADVVQQAISEARTFIANQTIALAEEFETTTGETVENLSSFADIYKRERQEHELLLEEATNLVRAVANVSSALGLTNPDPEVAKASADVVDTTQKATRFSLAKSLRRAIFVDAPASQVAAEVKRYDWQSPPILDLESTAIKQLKLVARRLEQSGDPAVVWSFLKNLAIDREMLTGILRDVATMAREQQDASSMVVRQAGADYTNVQQGVQTLQDLEAIVDDVETFFG